MAVVLQLCLAQWHSVAVYSHFNIPCWKICNKTNTETAQSRFKTTDFIVFCIVLTTHSLFLLILFTWCVDTQDPLVPASRLHSQHLILTGELDLGVAASRLVPQKNEHLRRALPNRQHSELQCNQCKGCFVQKRNGLRLTR